MAVRPKATAMTAPTPKTTWPRFGSLLLMPYRFSRPTARRNLALQPGQPTVRSQSLGARVRRCGPRPRHAPDVEPAAQLPPLELATLPHQDLGARARKAKAL